MFRHMVCILLVLAAITVSKIVIDHQMISQKPPKMTYHEISDLKTEVRRNRSGLSAVETKQYGVRGKINWPNTSATVQPSMPDITGLRHVQNSALTQHTYLKTHNFSSVLTKNASSSIGDAAHTNDTLRIPKYLFPVIFWEGGPNWNYLSFRRAIAMAMSLNRTLVMIPFHNHHINGWHKGWRSFQETFDITKLKGIVPLATPSEFRVNCMSEVNFLIQFNMSRYSESLSKFYRSQYERTRDDFNSLWGIRLPNISDAQSFINKANPATNLDVVSDIRCLGVHGPLQIKNLDIPGEIDLYKTVDKNFVRTEYVRNTADRLSDNICLGKPYVCIHWRNRTGEICEFNLLLNGAENCPHTMPLLSGSSNKTAQAVRDFMQSKRIKCAYVAAPPRQQEFIDDLRSEQQLQVFTSKKIISMKDKDARRLRWDNYQLSLVEQELCAKSQVFISCGKSNWSIFIKNQRDLTGKEVLYLRDLPGVPSEIYDLI